MQGSWANAYRLQPPRIPIAIGLHALGKAVKATVNASQGSACVPERRRPAGLPVAGLSFPVPAAGSRRSKVGHSA
jgi:hypothetical protein